MVLSMFLKVSNQFSRNILVKHMNYLGANFPTTPQAMEYFKKNNVVLGPAIAANAGLLSYLI